jgi:hypothetical protein
MRHHCIQNSVRRVSTERQAESDLSIPDQQRQALVFCAARGWEVVIEFIEPSVSGTDDRRPELSHLLTRDAPFRRAYIRAVIDPACCKDTAGSPISASS